MIVVPPVVPLGAAGGQRFWCLCDWSDACDWPVFWPVLKSAKIRSVLVRQIWPVFGQLASFETGLATDLATTFRCNSAVLPPIWPIGQFCSDYQELSKFSYI